MSKLSFKFLILLFVSLASVSASFIPGGIHPEDALKPRMSPLERRDMISVNPGYFIRVFKRADKQCPPMYNPCADSGCCAYTENCGTWSNTPGCCPTTAVCQGGISSRTTVAVAQVVTLSGSKVTLPTLQVGGFSFHIPNLITVAVPTISIALPTIDMGKSTSTSIRNIVLQGPEARVTGDSSSNNATWTPSATGSYASSSASGSGNGTAAGTAGGTESGTGSGSESGSESATATATITSSATLTGGTATVTGSTVTRTTSSANSGAVSLGANRVNLVWCAVSAMLAVLVGFAVVA